jgi:hypothetical protein
VQRVSTSHWARGLAGAVLLALACCCMAAGQQAQNLERSVKAAFLYKFLGYVEFPAELPPQVTVGVIGAGDIGTELAQIVQGRTVNGRPIVIKPLRENEALTGLQLVFIGEDVARPGQILRNAAQAGVLSVTEADNGLQQGSVINFRVVEDRVRFEVSLPAAEKSSVKLSSRLLSVAWQVQKGGQ